MSIRFFCPLGHQLELPDERAGTEGRCPVCQQRFFVPEISQAGTPSPAEVVDEPLVEAATSEPLQTTITGERDAPASAPIVAIEENLPGDLPATPSAALTTALTPPPLPSEHSVAVAESVPDGNPPITPQTVRWLAWRRSDALTGYAIVRPTARQLEVVYWLACLLPFAAAFCAAPALPHLYFSGAPLWAQLMLVVAMLQLAYAAWVGLVPDRSTVVVGIYLLAATATAYLIALAVICFSSETQLAALSVSGMRGAAAAWCLLALAISATASAACGWVVRQWHDQPATPGRS